MTTEAPKSLPPNAYVRDRRSNPDRRVSDGPRYAVELDRGFQAPWVIGTGDSPFDARQDALEKYQPFEPTTPSYEELSTTKQTREHIEVVRNLLQTMAMLLLDRGRTHDQSKLVPPEVDMFTAYTGRLKGMTYGSDEYKQCLVEMGAAGGPLRHHYDHNRHHPEHFADGIEGMNLLDILEMFVDWKAATMRHADGDLKRSIDLNRERFNMGSVDLAKVFHNSMRDLL